MISEKNPKNKPYAKELVLATWLMIKGLDVPKNDITSATGVGAQ